MAMPQASPISNPLQRLRFAATKPAVKLPAQRETQPIAATSSSEASILLINRENNSNSSNTTASPASTASTVLQTGDCQQVRRTGRFLQGGGGGQDEQRFGCMRVGNYAWMLFNLLPQKLLLYPRQCGIPQK